ncbi:MAG: hypothetical protein KF878_16040 [Planctomycetes bacterium]|nr:hypothetical protein [Planctomycetota bacterium]
MTTTLRVDHDASLLVELRARGGRADDHPARLPAEAITAAHLPARAVERFRVAGRPIVHLRPDLSAFVVDAACAGDLTCADATRLAPGAVAAVGRVAPATVEALGGRGLLELLVAAGVVLTYWHVGATLTVEAERAADGAYEADVAGEHVYFTNAEGRARVAFTLRVAASGDVTVVGRA